MARARSKTVDPDISGVYHCISRCVRQAFLCGNALSDRKSAIHDRLIYLSTAFAIDVCSFSILDNHFHTVLKTHPELIAEWTNLEIAQRWFKVFPKSIHRWAMSQAKGTPGLRAQVTADGNLPDEVAIDVVAGLPEKIATLRQRLASLSWFMRCLKHPIACTANAEDGCSGSFWEGRFKSIRVLDQAALLSIMVYVDLNIVRAGLATTPEESNHTSVQDRIHARQNRDHQKNRQAAMSTSPHSLIRDRSRSDETPNWLAPIDQLLGMTPNQYLVTVDLAGRRAAVGKRGSIPAELRPILKRLDLDGHAWCEAMTTDQPLYGSVIGSPDHCAGEADRRGVSHTICALDVWINSGRR